VASGIIDRTLVKVASTKVPCRGQVAKEVVAVSGSVLSLEGTVGHHLITLLHEEHYSVPIGIAIQDGNYVGKTGNESTNITTKNRKNIVPLLHAFAKDFLKVNYMFWTNQQPYFEQDLFPCFSNVGN
jgi:hypothetical protein